MTFLVRVGTLHTVFSIRARCTSPPFSVSLVLTSEIFHQLSVFLRNLKSCSICEETTDNTKVLNDEKADKNSSCSVAPSSV
jgi:hypothetical protein